MEKSRLLYFPQLCRCVVRSLSCAQRFATPWTAACQASRSFTISRSLLKLMSIESVPSNHLILCHPLLLLPSIFPSIKSWWVVCNSWHLLLPRLLFHSKRIHNANSYKGCCYRDRLDFILKYAILKSFVRKSWQFNS